MSDLHDDIREEDEVRALLRRRERGLEPPPFSDLDARARTRSAWWGPVVVAAAGIGLVLAMTFAPLAPQVAGPSAPSAPSVAQTASPAEVRPPGSSERAVTPCADVTMPAYLPWRDRMNTRAQRSASSQDVVTLTIDDLVVDGQPAELEVVAQADRPTSTVPPEGRRTLTFTSGLVATPAPPGMTPRPAMRSALRAEWYEPHRNCPYFSATLRSAGSNAAALERELTKIIDSMPRSAVGAPLPAPTWTTPLLPEAEAWSRIRTLFQTGPVARPVWLPPQVDRRGVVLRALEVTPTRVYEVIYMDSSGAPLLTFRLGPVESLRESGIGFCCVRAASAVLEYATHLHGDPSRPGIRRVRWEEQTRTLSFSSDRIAGEDMLRIAWELDRATAPENPYPGVRSKAGACARSSPEETVRALLALYGSRDRAALLDCYALDHITSQGTGVGSNADLPSTTAVTLQRRSDIAGRAEVMATWTFTSDPGAAFGRTSTQFFLLGLEDGAWRIYNTGTAPFGRPP